MTNNSLINKLMSRIKSDLDLIKLFKGSSKISRNILGLFSIKIANLIIGFLLVPVTLHYLDTTQYGIWIVMAGVFNWFSLFDVGMGNGLRNKLTERLAKNDYYGAKVLISTTYVSLTILFASIYLLFLLVNQFLDWSVLLNTDKVFREELGKLANIVFFIFAIKFISDLLISIGFAVQRPALVQITTLIGRVLSLLAIYFITLNYESSLTLIAVSLIGIPVLVTIIASIYLFNTTFKNICPRLEFVKFGELSNILNLGARFFILQISSILLFQSNNIIITQIVGPEEVTNFSIAFQYFSMATFYFSTILIPFWSGFTDAYIKRDFSWIKKTIWRLNIIWISLLFIVFGLLILSPIVISFWIGKDYPINASLFVVFAFYICINSYNSIFSQFFNGIGKLNIQLVLSIIISLIHIPLAIFLTYAIGVSGVLISMVIFGIITAMFNLYQYKLIITNRGYGVWDK